MSGTWVFGYGSLVAPESMARTLRRAVDPVAGWRVARLDGFGRRWNYGSIVLRGHWHHDGTDVRDGQIVSLGLTESSAEWCNGTAVRVDDDELARLDWRERDYQRTDVTDLVTVEGAPVDGRVVTYVPRRSAVERYEAGRDAGRAAVRREYWDLVHDAFARLGHHHLAQLVDHTPVPDVPVVEVTLVTPLP